MHVSVRRKTGGTEGTALTSLECSRGTTSDGSISVSLDCNGDPEVLAVQNLTSSTIKVVSINSIVGGIPTTGS